MQSNTAILILNLLGWLFVGLAGFHFAEFQIDLFVYGRPYDSTYTLAISALAAAGVVASMAAYCLKKIEAQFG